MVNYLIIYIKYFLKIGVEVIGKSKEFIEFELGFYKGWRGFFSWEVWEIFFLE